MQTYDKANADLYSRATTYINSAVKVWTGFTIIVMLLFFVASSGDFSFVLTLSSLVSVFSFVKVATTIETGKTVAGVSLKMMECYVAIFGCRLCAILPFEDYLPIDKSGDYLYRGCEGLGLCLAIWIVYCCRVRYANTYDPGADTFKNGWLIIPIAAFALVVHPHCSKCFVCDSSWAFALYLESSSVLPQLFMFVKEQRTQPHTSHFLAAQALSRLLSVVFWATCFTELAHPDHYINQYVGHWVMGVQVLQLVIMGDFIYHYIRCIRKGIPLTQVLSSDFV